MHNRTKLLFQLFILGSTTHILAQTSQNPSRIRGHLNHGSTLRNNKTAICFLNDAGDSNDIIKSEFIKLTMDKAPHIFVTTDTINKHQKLKRKYLRAFVGLKLINPYTDFVIKNCDLIRVRGRKTNFMFTDLVHNLTKSLSFNLEKWDVYNTKMGLLYIHHKDAPYINGIKYKNFQRITNLDSLARQHTTDIWAKKLHTIFNPTEWNKNVKKNNTFIFFCGHGSPQGKREEACGLKVNIFANVIDYLNKNLNFQMLGIASCYWPADRILKLMQRKKLCKTLKFALCTPISLQDPVFILYHGIVKNHSKGKSTYIQTHNSFFKGLQKAITKIKSIPKLRKIFNTVDAVQCSPAHSSYPNAQKPTIIYANSTRVREI